MELEVAGRVALVTGGGQGVGRALCLDLAKEGVRVAVNDLFEHRARHVAEEIHALGGQAMPVATDITDPSQVARMFSDVMDRLGPVTILVNNAGIIPERREKGGRTPRFLDMPTEDWARIVNLNLYGTLLCCKAALPAMVDSHWGRIINIISEAGRVGEANMAVYSGAKGAIAAFGKALAREHGRDGITINAVALGAVSHEGIKDGPLHPDATPKNNDLLARMLSQYPIGKGLGRVARPQDLTGIVSFLASTRSQFITGQTIGASGGFVMI